MTSPEMNGLKVLLEQHEGIVWRWFPEETDDLIVDPFQDFKVSDTPRSGPEEISGYPATAGPHNNKEIA